MPHDGGPAFPVESYDHEADMDTVKLGMTLRDYFAAAALQGMLANAQPGDGTPEEFAADAYAFADAMLAARARRKEPGA